MASSSSALSSQWHWGSAMNDDRGDEGENEEGDEGEEEDTPSYLPVGKDCVIFLIDCSTNMHEPFDGDTSFVKRCFQAAHTTLLEKLVSSDKDLVSIVLFGTTKSSNPGKFANVYVYQELDLPSVKRIKDIEDLIEEDKKSIRTEFGSSDVVSLCDALWTCSMLFSNSREKTANKRIMIFTNSDSPGEGPARMQAKTKAMDLRELGISIDVLHMARKGCLFNLSKFYKEIISNDDGTSADDYVETAAGFDTLLTRVRVKAHKKRALMKIPFTICSDYNIGVSVYSLVAETKKGLHTWIDGDAKEVVTRTRYECPEKRQQLLPVNIKAYMPYGGEKIIFEKEEVAKIKKFDDPGFVLLGFKPRDRLKRTFNVKNCLFLQPDETVISGSSAVFATLLERMIAKDKIAVCRLISRATSEPRFVYLLPQAERVDDDGSQIIAAGLHVVFLPYADDMRKLQYARNLPRASEEEKELFEKLVMKLDAKDFSSQMIENPSLQKHYRALESLALERAKADAFVDTSLPDVDGQIKCAGKYTAAIKEAIYPDGYNPEGSIPAKRKTAAAPKAPAAKKARTAAADDGDEEPTVTLTLDDVRAKWVAGQLGKYTVPLLKEACKLAKLKPKTKKQDLIDQLTEFLEK